MQIDNNCTTVCTKNNTRQSTKQIQEIVLINFFAVACINNQHSKPRNDILFNCSPQQWINECD